MSLINVFLCWTDLWFEFRSLKESNRQPSPATVYNRPMLYAFVSSISHHLYQDSNINNQRIRNWLHSYPLVILADISSCNKSVMPVLSTCGLRPKMRIWSGALKIVIHPHFLVCLSKLFLKEIRLQLFHKEIRLRL